MEDGRREGGRERGGERERERERREREVRNLNHLPQKLAESDRVKR